MSTKRVVLADGSRLLREMLHRIIDKANHLEVVKELSSQEGLSSAIERLCPEWVIFSRPYNENTHSWIRNCMIDYPFMRFIFLSAESNTIQMKWQTSYEDLTNLSLKDFIDILEKDLQHT